MNNNAQYWQTRVPLRVRVLGLLFLFLVLVVLGVLWEHWGQDVWVYSGLAFGVFAVGVYSICHLSSFTQIQTLFLDAASEFSLINPAGEPVAIRIKHIWGNAFSITLYVQIISTKETQRLTFWHAALAASSWRKLHIHLSRYQLQYQFADSKGAQ